MIKTPKKFRNDNIVYSDFPINFDINPDSGDLLRLTNEKAVKESIKNIILTNKGEKVFSPNFGSDIKSNLFENLGEDITVIVRDYIEEAVKTYEPRVNIISIDVVASSDQNELRAVIVFNVINKEEEIVLDTLLYRVR